MLPKLIPIDGWPGYFAGEDGLIYSRYRRGTSGQLHDPIPLAVCPDDDGRPRVNLCVRGRRRSFKSCQLIARAFHGPPPAGHECSHLNGDNTDNRPCNLAWETSQQNNARKREHGTLNIGAKNGHCLHAKERVDAIRREALLGAESQYVIASKFGVSQSYVSAIKHNQLRTEA